MGDSFIRAIVERGKVMYEAHPLGGFEAEGDWNSAQREYRARQRPNYMHACFHGAAMC